MMIAVNSDRDLRDAYVLIRALGKIQQTVEIRNLIAAQKHAIRSYNRRSAHEYPRGIGGDYDSCILLDRLPDGIGTIDEAVAYFERNCIVPRPCSIYDCTGQAFTTRYKVFKRGLRWYAYHFMSRDV